MSDECENSFKPESKYILDIATADTLKFLFSNYDEIIDPVATYQNDNYKFIFNTGVIWEPFENMNIRDLISTINSRIEDTYALLESATRSHSQSDEYLLVSNGEAKYLSKDLEDTKKRGRNIAETTNSVVAISKIIGRYKPTTTVTVEFVQ